MTKLKNRRLKTIAKWINEHCAPMLTARIVEGFNSGDRKFKGSRLRWPGKGKYGNRLIVEDHTGRVIIDHNSVEAYRSNADVEWKLDNWIKANGTRAMKKAHKRDQPEGAGTFF